MKKINLILLGAILLSSCNHKQTELEKLELTSWKTEATKDTNEASIHTIIDYVNYAIKNVKKEDRIAVFDMDGTIACERPFSMEMLCAYYLTYNSLPNCETHIIDTSKIEHIKKSIYDMHFDSEKLVKVSAFLSDTLRNKCIPVDTLNHTSRLLSKQFYKPMVKLIKHLHNSDFKVYIVSGSAQPFIRGVIKTIPELKIDPKHIIGTLTKYESIHYKADSGALFFLAPVAMLSNSSIGKAQNIYDKINKTPILAFGNTVNDFDMFALTSTNNTYKTLCILLNHDNDSFEAEYNPYDTTNFVRKNWNQPDAPDSTWTKPIFDTIMKHHKWKRMDMSKVFKKDSVFID
jgi:hypothetical protein